MFNQIDFENIVWDFLFTYRQFLLNGYMHKRVKSDSYGIAPATWNTILLSLEAGTVLGLAKLLENNDLGRKFDSEDKNIISEKIIKIRKSYIAHNDLSKMRNRDSFLKENQLAGSEIITIVDALKNRLIQYQKSYNFQIDVDNLFRETTQNSLEDLNGWLKSFKAEL